jgi:hypothetical protein
MVARLDGLPRKDKGVSKKYATEQDRIDARRQQKIEASRRYRERNREVMREKAKSYRLINREVCLERTKKWQRENPDKAKDAVYRRKYGISLRDYENMVSQRNGKCDICSEVKLLVVDHCHDDGGVRGLLCDRCNVGIGCLEDNPDRLFAAAKYIVGYTQLVVDRLERGHNGAPDVLNQNQTESGN